MRKLRIGATLLLATGFTLAPASVAHAVAGTGTGTDATGDIATPNADITSLTVTNNLTTVTAAVTMAAAPPVGTDASWVGNGGTRLVEVGVIPNTSGYTNTLAFSFKGNSAGVYDGLNPNTKVCDATASISGSTINFSAAASCFNTPARIDAFATSNLGTASDYAIVSGPLSSDLKNLQLVTSQQPGGGYLLGKDGGVFTLGDAPFYGSTGNLKLNQPVVGMAKNPAGPGYWFVASDGGVFTYGPTSSTTFYGSEGGKPLNKPIVGMAPTPSGNGYYLVASDGGIFTFGDAIFSGSMGGKPLNKPIVGMSVAANGSYYLVASDGGVFTFNAPFFDSLGSKKLNRPIIGMASAPGGYYLVAADGGVFTFGSATYQGSTATDLADLKDVSATGFSLDGGGYHIILNNGVVATFGSQYNFGDIDSTGVVDLNAPIVGGAINASY